MKVEVVTQADLDERFERLLGAVEAVGLRLSGVPGDGWVQEYFTREEAADYLRVSKRKLDSLFAKGILPHVKTCHGERGGVLFRRKDLDAFAEERVVWGRRVGERR